MVSCQRRTHYIYSAECTTALKPLHSCCQRGRGVQAVSFVERTYLVTSVAKTIIVVFGSHRALESLRVQCQTVCARSNHLFCRAKSISMHSEDILFEKPREAPRGPEKLREAPEAQRGSDRLREASRSYRKVAWGQFDLCQMDLLMCRLEASQR